MSLPASNSGRKPQVTSSPAGAGAAVVRVEGDLDLALAPAFGAAIEREIVGGCHRILIDLSAATFLDCVSIGALLRAVAPLRHEPDASVVLVGATGVVKRMLEMSGLDSAFESLPDLDEEHHLTNGWREHRGRPRWDFAGRIRDLREARDEPAHTTPPPLTAARRRPSSGLPG
jgi:anti-sigma B factor antagonist